MLTVSGVRTPVTLAEGTRVALTERVGGRFERRFRFPKTVDGDAIAATLTNGVLTISLPKREEVKARSIAISVN